MLSLRPYKPCDANEIVKWFKDERTFRLWGGDRFGTFPITADELNKKYFDSNGDCAEEDNFYPFTAFDEDGIVGHFIMRYLHGDPKLLRFGWVIVNDERRGKGCGREMLSLGLRYAFELLRVDRVTLGVFADNPSAYRCYLSVGFKQAEDIPKAGDAIIELALTKEEYHKKS